MTDPERIAEIREQHRADHEAFAKEGGFPGWHSTRGELLAALAHISPQAERLLKIESAARNLATQADGSLLATGYQRGAGNVVMVLEVSVNSACDLRDALTGASK